MMTNESRLQPLCQVPGCRRRPDRVVELDLVDSWEASPHYTTVSIHVGLCASCACEAERRLRAMLEARTEFYDLLHIIDAAVPYERQQAEKLERTEAEIERLELELGAARKTLRDTEAQLQLVRALRSVDPSRLATAGGGV